MPHCRKTYHRRHDLVYANVADRRLCAPAMVGPVRHPLTRRILVVARVVALCLAAAVFVVGVSMALAWPY